jgi:hypothetical protein
MSRKMPRTADELFGGGLLGNMLQGKYLTEEVYAWFEKRHDRSKTLVVGDDGWYRRNGHEYKVPYGLRATALKEPLRHSQIVNKFPWYVTWRSAKTGKRYKKYFTTVASALVFLAEQAQYVDPQACVISRHGYMIPPKLRNKIPSPYKWCPACMTARKFYRVRPEQFVYAMIRSRTPDEKGNHPYKERKLPLLQCRVCGTTTRDTYYRRSNQFWLTVKVKPGVHRVNRKARRKK